MSTKKPLSVRVLACLKKQGPLTTVEIAARLGEPRKRIQTALGSMQNQERVRRTEDEGERAFRYGATPHRWEVVSKQT